jgi:hypothetical protein
LNNRDLALSEKSPVDELLGAIERKLAADPSVCKRKLRALKQKYSWAADAVAESLNVSRASLTIQQLFDCESEFKEHVNSRKLSESSRASLFSIRNGMIREAKALGLFAEQFALEQEWKPAKEAVKGVSGVLSIITYMIKLLLHMCQLSDAILDDWGKKKEKEERCSHQHIISLKSSFRGAIRRAHLGDRFPLLRTEIATTFRAGARDLPGWLRSDIAAMIWKMRSEARLDRVRFSRGAALGLVERFQYLYGYVRKVMKELVSRMEELLDPDRIREYSLFLSKGEEWKRESIRQSLTPIANAMRAHPRLGDVDFTWVRGIVLDLPPDDDTDIDPEFDGSEILLDDLATIPGMICAERESRKHRNPRIQAWFALKEFVVFFLVTHPWPAECLRTCRIDNPKRNLFEGPIASNWGPSALFAWLKRARRKGLQIWQFDFSPANTGLGRYARGPLIPPLVEKLQWYLKYRRALLKGKPDPGTLLVNFAGKPFDGSEFGKFVSDICRKYIDSPVPVTEFRRKFLFDWLAEFPGDVENIAAILWIQAESVRSALKRRGIEGQSPTGGARRGWIRRCRGYWKF